MDCRVTFLSEGVQMPTLDQEKVSEWVEDVARSYGKRVGHVTYIFVDDAYILTVNRKFLRHDYYTDIITFDYSEGAVIGGDLFISLDTVRSNAGELGVPYGQELLRVVIHGILHLCGINDKGPGERETMEAAEDKALNLLEGMKDKQLGLT